MRACLLVFLLSGCQLIFKLGSDEDGDGTLDDSDGCPHIANEASDDNDGDGIPNECDLVPDMDLGEKTMFFSFFDEADTPTSEGTIVHVPGALELGTTTANLDFIELDVPAGDALIDVGFTILEHEDPNVSPTSFVQFGVYTVHRDFIGMTNINDRRGDNCFVGRNADSVTPGEPPNFLEINEDELDLATVQFDGSLEGLSGQLRLRREARSRKIFCQLTADDTRIDRDVDMDTILPLNGTLVVSASRLRVRIDYVWVVYRDPPTPALTPP